MTYHVQFPGLGLEFTLDRVAFTVFGMPIYWYGILIASGPGAGHRVRIQPCATFRH